MNIQDKIAKRLLVAGNVFLNGSDSWYTNLRHRVVEDDKAIMAQASVDVVFDGVTRLACEIAADEQSQVVGLQKYAGLPDGYAMCFPYYPPREVSYHMAGVVFPIDIMFIGSDSRVTKIVSNVEPGTRGSWGMSHVSAVVEANGGFCEKNNIKIGTLVDVDLTGILKNAAVSFDLLFGQYEAGQVDFDELFARAAEVYPKISQEIDNILGKHADAEFDLEESSIQELSNLIDQHLVDEDQLLGAANDNEEIDKISSLVKTAAGLGYMPAFYDMQEKRIIPSPGYHNIEVLGLNLDGDDFDTYHNRYVDGFIDTKGKFYTRGQMAQIAKSPYGEYTSEELHDQVGRVNPNDSAAMGFIQLSMRQLTAQETFDGPRKDIDPQMTPTNPTQDRYRSKDLPDVQTKNQPMDTNHSEQWGYIGDELGVQDELNPGGVGPNVRAAKKIK